MNTEAMHKLLARQLRRHFGSVEAVPPALLPFLAQVEQAYREADAERAMLEHSMETVSHELASRLHAMQAAIGERNEVQHALSLLEASLESSAHGVFVVDLSGKIQRYNTQFVRSFPGIEHTLHTGDALPGFTHIASLLDDPDSFWLLLAEKQDRVRGERVDVIRTRDQRILELTMHPQRMGEATVGYVWRFRDVTERYSLEEQLRQSQKMEAIGQLAGGIAHDFNNLLTVIRGNSELLALDDSTSPASRELVHEVLRATGRAAELTGQLLAFGRKQTLKVSAFDLVAAVHRFQPMLRRVIGTDIAIEVPPTTDAVFVAADHGQIEQVLMNLVINARDAMPTGGHIRLDVRAVHVAEPREVAQGDVMPPGAYGLLHIADTGDGIPATLLTRIFEPFFTTKSPGKGTGLGLAMVYGIVRQSQGYIEVESQAGIGTTFRLYLPLGEPTQAEDAPAEAVVRTGTTHRTILLAEDEDAVRRLVRTLLHREGYTILEAANGRDALQLATAHAGRIDLVISDVIMPELGGRDLVEALRTRWPALPVLYISGYTNQEIIGEDGHFFGDGRFLSKPFTSKDLITAVREALQRSAPTPAGGVPIV